MKKVPALLLCALALCGCGTTPGGAGLGNVFASSDKMVIKEKADLFEINIKNMGDLLKTTGLNFVGPTESVAQDGTVYISAPWQYSVNQDVEMTSPALLITAQGFADTLSTLPEIATKFGSFPSEGTETEQTSWWQGVLGFFWANPQKYISIFKAFLGG